MEMNIDYLLDKNMHSTYKKHFYPNYREHSTDTFKSSPTYTSPMIPLNPTELTSDSPRIPTPVVPLNHPLQLSVPHLQRQCSHSYSTFSVKTILKEPSISRNASKSSRTIRFQRQENIDCVSLLTSATDQECAEDNRHDQVNRKRTKAKLLRQPSSFTGEEILSLQETFSNLDKDGNGCLSHQELQTALDSMIPEEEIQSLLEEMDVDGDGEINYQVSKIRTILHLDFYFHYLHFNFYLYLYLCL